MTEFSPPAWGWSVIVHIYGVSVTVLPTRVGMVRLGLNGEADGEGSPHPRGDGPDGIALLDRTLAFSPPAWGWSGVV